MGANCSCLSNKIFYSDIQILEHSKIQNNFIITNNISKYLNNIIKIQSYIKGYLYRKKQFKPVKLVLSKTNPKKSFKITKANSIKEEELDKLYKEYPPLNDGIKVSSVKLSFPNQAEYSGEWNEELKERH